MNKKHLIWIIPLCFGIGFVLAVLGDNHLTRNYDLYNCIYNNADDNGFTNNPYLIEKIQDECICFRENNYTNLFEADC